MSISRIAQAANVSYATAWRIINNRPCRSEDAVQAVLQAMSRVGYSPSVTRRRGRPPKASDGIRTHNIALLHLRKGSSISTTVLTHVQRLLAERNLNLIFAHVESAGTLPQAIRAGNVDGILGYGEYPAEAVTPSLRRIPAVWMMTRTSVSAADDWGDRVKPDHPAIGRLAATYLLARGHEHVAYLNPNPAAAVFSERGEAFVAAARSQAKSVGAINAPPNPLDRHEEIAFMDQAAAELVQQWLATSPRPTGLFVPVDRITLRVHQQLLRHGIRPGRDVELVSCDREEGLLSLMRPRPASIDLNRETIARLAVERLLLRMREGVSAPSVVITVSPELSAGYAGDGRTFEGSDESITSPIRSGADAAPAGNVSQYIGTAHPED